MEAKMDRKLKDEWTTGLRSGQYKQGVGYLKQRVEGDWQYCCLGVLCEIAAVPQVPDTMEEDVQAFDSCTGQLNSELRLKFGLSPQIAQKLMVMNDTDQLTFTTIADWIEANL